MKDIGFGVEFGLIGGFVLINAILYKRYCKGVSLKN